MNGDRTASLYRKFGPTVLAYCTKLLGDRTAAEDATQEAFFRLHRRFADFRDDDEAIAWLWRVGKNYCLNQLRNRRLRGEVFSQVDLPSMDQERVITYRSEVVSLVDALPEPLREVAYLYHGYGFDQEQVAHWLRVSRRTVVTRLARLTERVHVLRRKNAHGSSQNI